jgi:16S rRNA pseudouridine516 synthase
VTEKRIRLDKYIASVTDYSRSDAKKLIKRGWITVDGEEISKPEALVAETAEVCLDDSPLRTAGTRYFMLHKPVGYVCANKDRLHTTVFALLEEDNADSLHVAGRLDIDTTGLVLITDDGRWAHNVTHPARQCFKTYLVGTSEPILDSYIAKFEDGLFIEDDKRRCLPAKLSILNAQSASLQIQEGKYHQVKQMFASLGNHVIELHREAVGELQLGDLPEGEYRELTADEVALFVD